MKKTNKILVTGGSGFIGSHLMKALGNDGVNYDIKESEFADINDTVMLHGLIKAVRPRVIVHLAAISNRKDVDKDPEQALKTNLIGSFNVMRIAHKYNIPVIVASSAAVEQAELSLYGITKSCMESLAMMCDNVTIARLYNVYGSGSKSVVNKFTRKIKTGKGIKLNGNPIRDYIYVDDVVEILLQMIKAKELPKLAPIGTKRSITLNKLVSVIQKIVEKDAIVVKGEKIKEIQYSCCPSWGYGNPKITIEQGIRRLL